MAGFKCVEGGGRSGEGITTRGWLFREDSAWEDMLGWEVCFCEHEQVAWDLLRQWHL